MFGIDLDKLVLVGVLVGLIVGPARLREWRRKLPQILGRVHALYQQGRADVTRNLDDVAPDWRDYDPRQFHPRRILRDLGEEAQRSVPAAPTGAGRWPRTGESPVESSPAAEAAFHGRGDRGMGDDAGDALRALRQEAVQRPPGDQRNPSRGEAARVGPPTEDAGDDPSGRRRAHARQLPPDFPCVGERSEPQGHGVETRDVRAETVGNEKGGAPASAASRGRKGGSSGGSRASGRPGGHEHAP